MGRLTWDAPVTALRVEVRTKLGRGPTSSGGCVDSQSAETASGGAEAGVGGGKAARGQKRHVVTDTPGLPPVVPATAANADDGGRPRRFPPNCGRGVPPAVGHLGRPGVPERRPGRVAGQDRRRVEVKAKPDGAKGFVPRGRRWAAGQTFACLITSRRLVWDYKRLPETSAAMV